MGNKIHLLKIFVRSFSLSLHKISTPPHSLPSATLPLSTSFPLSLNSWLIYFFIQIHTHTQNYLLSLYAHVFMVGNLWLDIYQESNYCWILISPLFITQYFSVSLYLALFRKAYCCDVLSVTSVSNAETTIS